MGAWRRSSHCDPAGNPSAYGGAGSRGTLDPGRGSRAHAPGGSRAQAGGKKTPEVIARLETLMECETAGDPMGGLKWTRRTPEKIAAELRDLGIQVSKNTVRRLLKHLGFSLRVNHKKIAHGSGRDRNEQFEYIATLRKRFAQKGDPIVSVDTKKRELVGNFKNPGVAWTRTPVWVNDHDFRSLAAGVAIPYGVYDLQANRGALFVGASYDTSEFAVDALEKWWRCEGSQRYPNCKRLLVLADGGGSNGSTRRAWKAALQEKLSDRHALHVTVCHYPTGASNWNPIEHRLFSEISKNWAGRPLDSYETILHYIRSTKTETGLRVKAQLVGRKYTKGVKISDDHMRRLRINKHEIQPTRNYTLSPRRNGK
ncbi:MAG: ISAzo13 family transposase [bacterium]